MKTKTTLPISQARREIFSIAEKVQQTDVYYTLTERGKPKMVVMSAEKFEELMQRKAKDFAKEVWSDKKQFNSWGTLLADQAEREYMNRKEKIFSQVSLIRDYPERKYGVDLKHKEDEYVKSLLYVQLIEKYKYPIENIEIGRYVGTSEGGRKKYTEVDVVVGNEQGNPEIIFEAIAFNDYEKNLEKVVPDLFFVAKEVDWQNSLKYIVYYSCRNQAGSIKEKIFVIDYEKYKSFSAWKRAGSPASKKIPLLEK